MHNIMFTDEAKIQINGCINQHNCRIWNSIKPHVTHKSVHDSPKQNIWWGLMCNRIFGPFVFTEKKTINCAIFLDTLELFLFPQLDDLPNAGNIYLQMHGAPPHYRDLVRAALDETPKHMDQLKWTYTLASQKPWFNPSWFFLLGVYQEHCVWQK